MSRFLVGAAWAVIAVVATAAEPPLDRPTVTVGFGNVSRTGSWTPVTIEWPATAGLSTADRTSGISFQDADGQWVQMPAAAITPSPDGRLTARALGRFGRPEGRVRVRTGLGGPVDLDCPAPLASTDTVILVLGELPSIDRAARLLARDDGSRPRVVTLSPDTAGLPDDPRAFDGLDAVVVCGRAAAGVDHTSLSAIDGWVRRGGRLVLLAGASAAAVAEAGGPAASWLPGPVARMVPLRRLAAIETFARSPRPLDKAAIVGLEVPLFENAAAIDGVVDVHDGPTAADLPLVVRRGHGLGTISWVALDLDADVFRTWQGADTLLVELLGGGPSGRAAAKGAGRAGETNRLALDLAGQLRRAVDRFPGVRPVPFEVVALLGAAIIGCLFPLDWWLSRAAPPWRAWITLPVLAIALTGVVQATGHRWHGDGWQRTAASVVDIDGVSRLARGTGWAGVWSPANDALAVEAAPSAALAVAAGDAAISWWADSGRGLGATDAPVAHPSLATSPYGYGRSLARLEGVPVAAASSRLFEAEWVATLAGPPVTCALEREAQGTLRGSLTHHLPFPLEQCVLIHAGWLYDVGRLEPGIPVDPGIGRGPRSLAASITRRTQHKDRDVAVRWDTADTDIARILEIAGFHAAAGGAGFTSLEPGRLGRLDLSPLLDVDRAILVGTGPAGIDWTITPRSAPGGSLAAPPSSAAAIWRIVMPLELP